MQGILESMIQRLFALVVALAIVSAPVALALCQITCESKGVLPSMAHRADGHAAHHQAPAKQASCHEVSGARSQLSPVNGWCDHSVDAAPSLVAARHDDTGGSLLAAVPSVDSIALIRQNTFIAAPESARSDRLAIPRAVPLRV